MSHAYTMTAMEKKQAIDLLGGSISKAAAAFGCTYRAVHKWPDHLPPTIADRVVAAFARKCDAEKRRASFWEVLRTLREESK